jgi:chromosome partitioning protein
MTRSFQMRVPSHIRYLVIDTPAALQTAELAEFTRGAHAILMPVLPSDIDIHAATRLISDLLIVAKVSRRMGRLGVVANRVRENTLGYRKLMRFLDRLSIAVIGELRDSQNYVYAADNGISIHEMQPSRVRKDLESWKPITEWLEAHLETALTARDLMKPKKAAPVHSVVIEETVTRPRPDEGVSSPQSAEISLVTPRIPGCEAPLLDKVHDPAD